MAPSQGWTTLAHLRVIGGAGLAAALLASGVERCGVPLSDDTVLVIVIAAMAAVTGAVAIAKPRGAVPEEFDAVTIWALGAGLFSWITGLAPTILVFLGLASNGVLEDALKVLAVVGAVSCSVIAMFAVSGVGQERSRTDEEGRHVFTASTGAVFLIGGVFVLAPGFGAVKSAIEGDVWRAILVFALALAGLWAMSVILRQRFTLTNDDTLEIWLHPWRQETLPLCELLGVARTEEELYGKWALYFLNNPALPMPCYFSRHDAFLDAMAERAEANDAARAENDARLEDLEALED